MSTGVTSGWIGNCIGSLHCQTMELQQILEMLAKMITSQQQMMAGMTAW
jgi:hypothetical protein